MRGKSLGELAEFVGGKVVGDAGVMIKGVSTLERAGAGEISFLSNRKYETQVKTTGASAVIVPKEIETDAALLVVDDTYYAMMQIVVLLYGHRRHKKIGISKNASIAETAVVGANCQVSDFVTISDNVKIGENSYIYPGVFVGPNVEIGADCIIYPNAVIYDECKIGNRVIIHSNATIGEDGYGFATHKGIHHKIPQIGRAVLEDDVEIGSGCSIERGALDDTVIGKGSKIGDMVAIGHGTKIGPYCLLVPHVGISGSTTLGHHCVVGGQVGVVGHLKIGNMVTIGAQSGVASDLPDGVTVLGTPAVEANLGKRILATMQYLPDMRKRIRKLEKQLANKERAEK